MKNIYELMNEIKTDTEDYPQEVLSEFEAKKWNKKLSKELKRPRRKKYASIAACAVICMALLAAGPFREQVKAAMNSTIDSLNEWLAMDITDRDISPYTNVINTSVKDDKIDVKVEAVVVDDRELLISTIQDFSKRKDIKKHMKQLDGDVERLGIWGLEFDSFDEIRKELKERPEEDPIYNEIPFLGTIVTLDGEQIKGTQMIKPKDYEKGKMRVIYRYDIDRKEAFDLSKELEMKIEFQDVNRISDGKWEFAFKADGRELAANTMTVDLDQKVALPDGSEIRLTSYKKNELGTYIYYEGKTPKNYSTQFRGTNDREETVWIIDYGNGRFQLDLWNEMRTQDIESLTLSVYSAQRTSKDQSVKESSYKPYGEPFTIPAK